MINEEKFLVYALSKYDLDYCFNHMDEILKEYLEAQDEDSRNISNK